MTNTNKINQKQKTILAEFMEEHSDLAKNILPNCGQGRVTSDSLWKNLANQLNAEGPPTKDTKSWRKVYTDQKYLAKKKLIFNKKAKEKTGGGPFEEIFLTKTDELIITASGLEATVEGLSNVRTFGALTSAQNKYFEDMEINNSPDILPCSSEQIIDHQEYVPETPLPSPIPKRNGKENRKISSAKKLKIIENNIENQKKIKLMIEDKLSQIINIEQQRLDIEKLRLQNEEKILKLKEEKVKMVMQNNKMLLSMKVSQLKND